MPLSGHLKLCCKSAILEGSNYVRRHKVISGYNSQLYTNELPAKKTRPNPTENE